MRFGRPVLLEEVGDTLEASLDPLLLKQIVKHGTSLAIKIGDTMVPYHADFRFYMTTKLPNPHYAPEVGGDDIDAAWVVSVLCVREHPGTDSELCICENIRTVLLLTFVNLQCTIVCAADSPQQETPQYLTLGWCG